jgi:hypothetical protein
MEGTGSTDDMRLLQDWRNRFSLPWVRIWFLGVGKSDIINNVRSILGAIDEDGVMVRLQVISKQSLCRGQALNDLANKTKACFV